MFEQQPSSYLIFTSRTDSLLSVNDLSNLLHKAYRENEASAITGMLIYMEVRFMNKLEGRFMQLMEGDHTQIQLLYDKIRFDRRHNNILLLSSGQQPNASFRNWSMSYVGQVTEQLGYKPLENKLFESSHFKKRSGPAYFLKIFYEYNRELQNDFALRTAEFQLNK